jgi:hypothetical protein
VKKHPEYTGFVLFVGPKQNLKKKGPSKNTFYTTLTQNQDPRPKAQD